MDGQYTPCCSDHRHPYAQCISHARPPDGGYRYEVISDVEGLAAAVEEHIWDSRVRNCERSAAKAIERANLHAPTSARADPVPPSPYSTLIFGHGVDGDDEVCKFRGTRLQSSDDVRFEQASKLIGKEARTTSSFPCLSPR